MAEEIEELDTHEDVEIDRDLVDEEDLVGQQETKQDLNTAHLTVRELGESQRGALERG